MTFSKLCEKEVISIKSGKKIGYVDDVEFDKGSANIERLIVYGKPKLMGFKGKEQNIIIDWCDVVTFGDDTILIKGDYERVRVEVKQVEIG